MKILLVEDDKPTAAVLSELLTAQYYTVELATDGQIGLAFATSGEFDLILLDLLIPKLDGISLCRQLRRQGYQKPILLLTAKDSSTDVVKGLDAGADDYVTKPYDLSELLARIRALLRRGETNIAPTLLTWGELQINPVSAEVTFRGNLISLSPKEYALLGLFLRNPQRVFSRSDIIDRLWSIDTTPSEGAVTNLIKDLRQKLKSFGMTADLLETVYGLGYRLKSPPHASSPEPEIKESGSSQQQRKDLSGVHQVLKRYRDTFAARVTALRQVEQALQAGDFDLTLQQNAAQEAHRLAGALGSFGYEVGSQLARSIEQLLSRPLPLPVTDMAQLSSLLPQLQDELTKPPKPLDTRALAEPPIPIVLMVDEDVCFAEQLKQNAFAWGFQVEAVSSLMKAKQYIANAAKQRPNVVLLSLQDTTEKTLSNLSNFRRQFPTVPVLVIAPQDSLSDRVMISRLGAERFLYKSIDTTEIFGSIAQVLSKSPTAEAKVMILDDDAIVLETLCNLLQPWGLQVNTLQDAQQFWTVLTATDPDLLVLDLEMPTFNGIDLCRVVRQDPRWGNLPILVVTAHTDMTSIQNVFAAGADDFIGKPVVGPELVTRVISRIDRSRLQQELEVMKRRIGT